MSTQDQSETKPTKLVDYSNVISYYSEKIKSNNINITSKEWYNYVYGVDGSVDGVGGGKSSTLLPGFLGSLRDFTSVDGINGKKANSIRGKSTPLDKILSYLLLNFPQYINDIKQHQQGDELNITQLLQPPPKDQSAPEIKDGKSSLDSATQDQKPQKPALGLYAIFLKVQDRLKGELDAMADRLSNELVPTNSNSEYGGPSNDFKDKDTFKQNLKDYLQGKKAASELYTGTDVKALQNAEAFKLYAEHAKTRLAEKAKQVEAELKAFKKAINEFARENGELPRLTKRNAQGGKHANYRVIELDDPEKSKADADAVHISKKAEKRVQKDQEAAGVRKYSFLYPLARAIPATYGTWILFATLCGLPIIPTSFMGIMGMVALTSFTFITAFYSNISLKSNLQDYRKGGGFWDLLWERDPKPDSAKNSKAKKPFWAKCLTSLTIMALTLGVISIYAFPLFTAISGLGMSATASLTLGLLATAWMAMAAGQIFMPKVSKFVREMSEDNFAKPRNFLDRELLAPIRAGKDWKEKTKNAFTHALPNALRMGFVLACVGVANWATFGSLTGTVKFTAGAMPGLHLGGNPIVAGVASVLIVLNALACFAIVYDGLHKLSKKMGWQSSIEKNKANLDKAMIGQASVSDSSSERYTLYVNTEAADDWKHWDIGIRAFSALGSMMGIVGTALGSDHVSGASATMLATKVGSATVVSMLNKMGGSTGKDAPETVHPDDTKPGDSKPVDPGLDGTVTDISSLGRQSSESSVSRRLSVSSIFSPPGESEKVVVDENASLLGGREVTGQVPT